MVSAMLRDRTVLAVGNRKAYAMLLCYVGLCELHRATGEPDFLTAARLAWTDVHANRLYLTGGASAGEHFHPDGHLPNDEAAHIQETCVTTTWLQLNGQLLRLTGEERFAAAFEQTLFNQLLGAQKPDGSGFGYYIPLEGRKPFRPDSPGSRGMDCCNSSGPRALALAPTLLGTLETDGFRLNTFASAEWRVRLNAVPVKLTIESGFPQDGSGTLRVTPERPVAFRLLLRIPRWTAAPKVTLGQQTWSAEPGTYLEIQRQWRPEEVVRFSFPFQTQVHRGFGSNQGRVAVTVGPLVLALDTADNPGVDDPANIALAGLRPEDLDLQTQPASGPRSGPDPLVWTANLHTTPHPSGDEPARFRGRLRPFFDAGSWNSTRFAVWLRRPASAEPNARE